MATPGFGKTTEERGVVAVQKNHSRRHSLFSKLLQGGLKTLRACPNVHANSDVRQRWPYDGNN